MKEKSQNGGFGKETNNKKNESRHVLTGQIPPQQRPLCHGQQLSEALSISEVLVEGYGLDK